MTSRKLFSALACYAAVALLAVGFVVLRARTINRFAVQTAPSELPEYPDYRRPPDPDAKPFFSLQTNHTYATTDRARIFVNYRGLDNLDFRVYRVKDPVQFFKQLNNPHQVGKDEEESVGAQIKRKPTFLEKLRAFKNGIYRGIKTYVRSQLQRDSRKGFNQKFRADSEDEDEERNRTPLNVADYARVPLLNPDQMVSSWREKLPPLEDVYERRKISLGRREPGVYLVEAVHGDLRAFGIVIVTDLALVEKTSRDGQLLVYAVERKTGAPREGVRVEVFKDKKDLTSGVTDAQGLLRLKIEQKKPATEDEETAGEDEAEGGGQAEGGEGEEEEPEEGTSDSYLILARAGEDFAISDLDSFYFGGYGEDEGGGSADVTSLIYTDRPVYRPQQKVYFKGILRRRTEAGYRLVTGRASVSVEDTSGGRIYEQELALSSRGTFSGELDLPEEAPLGSYNVTVEAGEARASGYFEVQEYKKPEYKVSASASAKYVRSGEKARFTVSAKYFFGAPVTRGDVKYYVHRSRYYPWWGKSDDGDEEIFGADPTADDSSGGEYYGYDDQMVQEGEGKLDRQGQYTVEFTIPQPDAKDAWDYTYRLEAQVTDAARRTFDASASTVGVRGNVVATARPERYVYYQGDTARIQIHAADHEGRPAQTRVKLTFVERRWLKVTKRTEAGDEYPGYEIKETELASGAVETNAQGDASYDYAVTQPGSVHIKTTVEEGGRQVTNEGGSVWVADRENRWTDVSYEGEGVIKLVPDKKSYRAGETAHVLALLPTDDAHLLVTTELMSVLSVRELRSPGRAVVIDVPVEARYAPNVYLNVTYVKRSEMYTQDAVLVVPPRDRLLDLQIIPNKKEFKPRETVSYTLLARDLDGKPVPGAEVSLGVVDESIYSIAPESVGDIRREFYGRRYNEVQTNYSVNYYFNGYAGKKTIQLAQNKKPYQLADFKDTGELVNPRVRKIFKDTAFWQPAIVTGGDGKALVKVELPDNLTTWRATARAVTSDTRVGVAVSKVVERKDVIIRVASPRFMTAGDTVTLSGIVHNYLKADKATQISIDVQGAQLLDTATQTVNIPSQGETRINWRVQAAQTGELRILAKALTDTESDAVETGIPVVPRGLKQTRADSFAFSEEELDKTVTLALPANADPNARSLRVEAAPSVAGTLFGALDYLTSYPYGCTEQTMSSFLPTVIVAQTLQNVQSATIRDTNNINRKVSKGLRRLYNFQHDDGGWGWWEEDPTDAFMTAYVVDGLSQARRAGYEVDDDRLEKGRAKLRGLLGAGKDDAGKDLDLELRAYMTYALAESGEADARHLNDLFNQRDKLRPYGRALLALALHARGDARRAQTLAADIERTARADGGGAFWVSNGNDGDVEATALSVKALSRITPQSQLLPRAARWLVVSRKFGYHWRSTKETAFAIFGLTDYLKASRELEADYALEVYVGGEQVLTRQVTAADAASAQSFVVQRKGAEVGSPTEVRVVKRGAGVLYLSTTLVHHTNEEQVRAAGSDELKLAREYLRLRLDTNERGEPAWKTEPLTGDVRSGDVIVSRLTIEGSPARYLMVEDPIPAGCEQVEQVSGIELNHNEKGWTDWYSAREFRDNRTVFFLSYFGGKAAFSYAMRVQVPGQFRAAPARVELMYLPSVQANSATFGLTILDK